MFIRQTTSGDCIRKRTTGANYINTTPFPCYRTIVSHGKIVRTFPTENPAAIVLKKAKQALTDSPVSRLWEPILRSQCSKDFRSHNKVIVYGIYVTNENVKIVTRILEILLWTEVCGEFINYEYFLINLCKILYLHETFMLTIFFLRFFVFIT